MANRLREDELTINSPGANWPWFMQTTSASMHSYTTRSGVSKKGKAALSLGGSWNEYTSTVWRIDAVFGDDGSPQKAPRDDAEEVVEAQSIRQEA